MSLLIILILGTRCRRLISPLDPPMYLPIPLLGCMMVVRRCPWSSPRKATRSELVVCFACSADTPAPKIWGVGSSHATPWAESSRTSYSPGSGSPPGLLPASSSTLYICPRLVWWAVRPCQPPSGIRWRRATPLRWQSIWCRTSSSLLPTRRTMTQWLYPEPTPPTRANSSRWVTRGKNLLVRLW